MSAQYLTLNGYQSGAIATDRTKMTGSRLDPILGLFGEAGSLLSEVKKKHRDSRSYLGFEDSVVEEMGDVLWYLAVIASHSGISLAEIAAIAVAGSQSAIDTSDMTIVSLQPQHILPLAAPNAAFERTLLQLASAVGQLADANVQGHVVERDVIINHLATIFRIILASANEAGVTLDQAAVHNLGKAEDRWPTKRVYPTGFFDDGFPEEEQLPRDLTVDIFERTAKNGKTYVIQRCNGIYIGDRLTDNIVKPDDYRFHDAFHYAYVGILGWSPVIRALFKLKRKSESAVDEGQDGARAILIEEGVATYVFGQAKQLGFFKDQKAGDLGFTFLKSVRQFVRGYEPGDSPLWLWEEAILRGNDAFRFLQEHRRGRLVVSLRERSFKVEELPL